MDVNELIAFAIQGMSVGVALESMVILLGYVVRFGLRMFRKGG